MVQVYNHPPGSASRGRRIPIHLRPAPASPAGQVKAGNKIIMLPTMEGFCFEKIKNLVFLEAKGNYAVLHFKDGRQTMVCKTLRDLEQLLPQDAFVRIHRSHTIHIRHLKKYAKGKGGHVTMAQGKSLAVSVGQRDTFLAAVKKYYGVSIF